MVNPDVRAQEQDVLRAVRLVNPDVRARIGLENKMTRTNVQSVV